MEVDQESSEPEQECHECDTHLAPHGDVILSLPGSDGSAERTLIQVDQVILSRHSPVFASLFKFPYDTAVNEEYDGIPVVRLEDDRRVMTALLELWYCPAYVH